MKKKKFKRQCFWLKRLGEKWRKPRGRQSKLKKEKKGKQPVPKIGFGSNKKERNMIIVKGELKKPVRIMNMKDLEKIDPKKEIGIVASSVGTKKAIEMLKKAKELGIKIFNKKFIEKKGAKKASENKEKTEKEENEKKPKN